VCVKLATAKKLFLSLGVLLAVITGSFLYVQLGTGEGALGLNITASYATFTVNESGNVIVAGREQALLLNGTKTIAVNKTVLSHSMDGNVLTYKRVNTYKGVPSVKTETWTFDTTSSDITLFPVKHTITLDNAAGYMLRYKVDKLTGAKAHVARSPERFGHQMSVEFEPGYKTAKVYKSGYMQVDYPVLSASQTFNVRLFDPPGAESTIFTPLYADTNAYGSIGDSNFTSNSTDYQWWVNNVLVAQGQRSQALVCSFDVANCSKPNLAFVGNTVNGGYIGDATASFNGISQSINITHNTAWTNLTNLTIAIRLNPANMNKQYRFFMSDTGSGQAVDSNFGFEYVNSTDRYRFILSNGTSRFQQDFGSGIGDSNKWTSFVFTYNGSYITAYKDGVLAAQNANAVIGRTNNKSTTLYLGYAFNVYFNGSIDDFGIYNRTWSLDEIQYYADSGTQGKDLEILNTSFFNDTSSIIHSKKINGVWFNSTARQPSTRTISSSTNLAAPGVSRQIKYATAVYFNWENITNNKTIRDFTTSATDYTMIPVGDYSLWSNHIVPLTANNTAYNYTWLRNYTQTVFDSGSLPFIFIPDLPLFMRNDTTGSAPINESMVSVDNVATYLQNVVTWFSESCADGTLTNCPEQSLWKWYVLDEKCANAAREAYWCNATSVPAYKSIYLYNRTAVKIQELFPNAEIYGSNGAGTGYADATRFINSTTIGGISAQFYLADNVGQRDEFTFTRNTSVVSNLINSYVTATSTDNSNRNVPYRAAFVDILGGKSGDLYNRSWTSPVLADMYMKTLLSSPNVSTLMYWQYAILFGQQNSNTMGAPNLDHYALKNIKDCFGSGQFYALTSNVSLVNTYVSLKNEVICGVNINLRDANVSVSYALTGPSRTISWTEKLTPYQVSVFSNNLYGVPSNINNFNITFNNTYADAVYCVDFNTEAAS
jgi:hypothetical protein